VWRVLALPLSDAVWALPGLSALTRDLCAFLPLSVALSCLATVFFCSALGFAAGFAVLATIFFAAALAAGLAFSLLFSAVLAAGLTFSLLFSAAVAGLAAVFLLARDVIFQPVRLPNAALGQILIIFKITQLFAFKFATIKRDLDAV